MCVCLSVFPQAILAVRAITSKTKDTIVLSVEFGVSIERHFLKHVWLERFYLPWQGRLFCLDVQFTCNVSATVCMLLRMEPYLIARRGPSLGTGAMVRAHVYVHRHYNVQDKAGQYTIAQLSGPKPAMLGLYSGGSRILERWFHDGSAKRTRKFSLATPTFNSLRTMSRMNKTSLAS